MILAFDTEGQEIALIDKDSSYYASIKSLIEAFREEQLYFNRTLCGFCFGSGRAKTNSNEPCPNGCKPK